MKHRPNPLHRYPHPRAASFADLRPIVDQHLFDIRPRDAGLFVKNRLKDALVFGHSLSMVSLIDTIVPEHAEKALSDAEKCPGRLSLSG